MLADYPDYARQIDLFNQKTDVFAESGHNWPLDVVDARKVLEGNSLADFDLFLTAVDDHLVVLKYADLGATIGGVPVIDVTGSEIRMSGKNARRHPFTPKALDAFLHGIGAREVSGRCFVKMSAIMGAVRGRGKSEVTRVKLNPHFYVARKSCELISAADADSGEEEVSFKKTDVHQVKSGISIHLSTKFDAQAIYEGLYK